MRDGHCSQLVKGWRLADGGYRQQKGKFYGETKNSIRLCFYSFISNNLVVCLLFTRFNTIFTSITTIY